MQVKQYYKINQYLCTYIQTALNKLQTQLTFFVFFFFGIHFRGKYRTKKFVSCNFLYCWKSSEIYQDATAASDEPSTYQELAVTLHKTELPYHNTKLK